MTTACHILKKMAHTQITLRKDRPEAPFRSRPREAPLDALDTPSHPEHPTAAASADATSVGSVTMSLMVHPEAAGQAPGKQISQAKQPTGPDSIRAACQ